MGAITKNNCRYGLGVMILVAFIGLLVVFPGESSQRKKPWTGRVIKVLDGDSLLVKRQGKLSEIRLYGIDAPEYDQPGGERAHEFLRTLLMKKNVTVFEKDKDSYHRIVAVLEFGERQVNREVVRAGMAWVYRHYCKESDVCDELRDLEENARLQHRGLWQETNAIPPWQWRREKRQAVHAGQPIKRR